MTILIRINKLGVLSIFCSKLMSYTEIASVIYCFSSKTEQKTHIYRVITVDVVAAVIVVAFLIHFRYKYMYGSVFLQRKYACILISAIDKL